MCKAFNDLMKEQRQDGIKAGRREGKREGKKEEKLQIVRRMLKAGMDEKIIVQMTKCTREELGIAAGR